MSPTYSRIAFVWWSAVLFPGLAPGGPRFDYRVLATSKTSTMEREMNEAAGDGFVFSSVMGGQTSRPGKEVVVIMSKVAAAPQPAKREYRLLAASKTSTMQKEMQELGGAGFEYKGQTVFETQFGSREVVVIMERDTSVPLARIEYLLLAAKQSSTMQEELQKAGGAGFRLVGFTVAETALGGAELVSILRRQ